MNASRSACPDWPALVATRDAVPESDPAGWSAACEHLRHCRDCRPAALAADPTLLFLDLGPRVETSAAEVAAMGRQVADWVRLEGRRSAPRHPVVGFKIAAGLLLAAGSLWLQPQMASRSGRLAFTPRPAARVVAAAVERASQPLLDDLGLPQARIIELRSQGMDVVMVVDASLDV